MKKGRVSSGYTIVELMIVLAVSAALLVTGLLLVGNQQQKTELTTSTNDMKQLVDSIINTVSSGYYQNNNDFQCSGQPGAPAYPKIGPPSGGGQQGTNSGCVFLGKAIQFAVNNDRTALNVFTVVGLQYKDANGVDDAGNITEAAPTALATTTLNNTAPNTDIERDRLGYGLSVLQVKYTDSSGTPFNDSNSIAFVTDFAGTNPSTGGQNSGSRNADLFAIKSTSVADNTAASANQIKYSNFVAASSVTICFNTSVRKYAVLTIGSNGRQLNTQMNIKDYNPTPTECS